MQAVLRYGLFNLLAACQIQSVVINDIYVKDHHGRWLDGSLQHSRILQIYLFVEEFDVGAHSTIPQIYLMKSLMLEHQ